MEKKRFTSEEVIEMLKQQREACAGAITSDNLSEFTARLRIRGVDLVLDAKRASHGREEKN